MPAIDARSYPPRPRPRSRRRLALRSLRRPGPPRNSWAALLARVFARCDPLSRLWRTTAPGRRANRSRIHSAPSITPQATARRRRRTTSKSAYPQLFASKTPFFAQRAPPLSSTGWPRPKKGAPKAAHPAANGTSTRLNRLTRKPKRAFIVPIHDIQRSIYGPKTRFRNGPIIGEKTTLFAPVRYREHNISEQTFYRWKKEYGNMELADFWVPYKVGRGF